METSVEYDKSPNPPYQKQVTTQGYTPLFDRFVQQYGLVTAGVYGVIWRHCQMHRKVCDLSQSHMAEILGLARETVLRSIAQLVQDKWVVDTTPDAVGMTHVYICSRKVQVVLKETVVYDDTCDVGSQVPVTDDHTPCDLRSHKDTSIPCKETIRSSGEAPASGGDASQSGNPPFKGSSLTIEEDIPSIREDQEHGPSSPPVAVPPSSPMDEEIPDPSPDLMEVEITPNSGEAFECPWCGAEHAIAEVDKKLSVCPTCGTQLRITLEGDYTHKVLRQPKKGALKAMYVLKLDGSEYPCSSKKLWQEAHRRAGEDKRLLKEQLALAEDGHRRRLWTRNEIVARAIRGYDNERAKTLRAPHKGIDWSSEKSDLGVV